MYNIKDLLHLTQVNWTKRLLIWHSAW